MKNASTLTLAEAIHHLVVKNSASLAPLDSADAAIAERLYTIRRDFGSIDKYIRQSGKLVQIREKDRSMCLVDSLNHKPHVRPSSYTQF
jgi:hypothetical protein